MLHFAVFGDIHGRIALMITMARLWEQQTGQRLAGILQVGDMGAFPDTARLDDATARMARDDDDELGFAKYCVETEEGALYLGGPDYIRTLRGPIRDMPMPTPSAASQVARRS